jgi:hypothetical protein
MVEFFLIEINASYKIIDICLIQNIPLLENLTFSILVWSLFASTTKLLYFIKTR